MARVRVAARSRRQASRAQRAQHDPGRGRSERSGCSGAAVQPRADGRCRRRPRRSAPPSRAGKAPAAEKRAAATQLRSVRFAKIDNGYAVTLAGNGPLLAANGRRSEGPAAPRAARFPRRRRGLRAGGHQRQERRHRSRARRDQQPRAADHPRRDRPRAQDAVHGRDRSATTCACCSSAPSRRAAAACREPPAPVEIAEPVVAAPAVETPTPRSPSRCRARGAGTGRACRAACAALPPSRPPSPSRRGCTISQAPLPVPTPASVLAAAARSRR